MTERVYNIVYYTLVHFWENWKKVKIEVTGPKTVIFLKVTKKVNKSWINQKHIFSVHVTLFLAFCIFLKNAPEYIDPSGHFVFHEISCSSNFLGRTSPRCCSRGAPGGWINIFFLKIFTLRRFTEWWWWWLLYKWGNI